MEIPLPTGEGGPKGRVRGTTFLSPSPAASRHPLPLGEGSPRQPVQRDFKFPFRQCHFFKYLFDFRPTNLHKVFFTRTHQDAAEVDCRRTDSPFTSLIRARAVLPPRKHKTCPLSLVV